jgi:hypothetical protein
VGGVGHIVPCARARQVAQTALQANSGAHESSQALAGALGVGGGVEWACRRAESANTASIALHGMGQRLVAVSALLVQAVFEQMSPLIIIFGSEACCQKCTPRKMARAESAGAAGGRRWPPPALLAVVALHRKKKKLVLQDVLVAAEPSQEVIFEHCDMRTLRRPAAAAHGHSSRSRLGWRSRIHLLTQIDRSQKSAAKKQGIRHVVRLERILRRIRTDH